MKCSTWSLAPTILAGSLLGCAKSACLMRCLFGGVGSSDMWQMQGGCDEMHLLRDSPGGFHMDDVQAVSDACAVLCAVLRPQAAEHPLLRARRVALQLLTDGAAARGFSGTDDSCSCRSDTHPTSVADAHEECMVAVLAVQKASRNAICHSRHLVPG